MLGSILEIVGKFIPDQNVAKKAAAEMEKEFTKQMEMKSEIIQAEIKNGSGKWRVQLMYLCMFFVSMHWFMYDFIPYIITMFNLNLWVPQTSGTSVELWSFLKIGVGGYITSRGVEKSVSWWKSK